MPWAVIVGKIFLTKDVRKVGDGNPGAVNAWKSGGYAPGILSVTLEICKSLVPIYLAFSFVYLKIYKNLIIILIHLKIIQY